MDAGNPCPRQASEEEAGMLFGLTQDGKVAGTQLWWSVNCAQRMGHELTLNDDDHEWVGKLIVDD